jgi:hypothetical protein
LPVRLVGYPGIIRKTSPLPLVEPHPVPTPPQDFTNYFTFMIGRLAERTQKILISQDILPHYCGNSSCSKNLFLENIKGAEVFKTEDPNVFRLSDGTLLRKKSTSQLYLE